MLSAEELLEKAHRYRAMAMQITDAAAIDSLMHLSAEYAAMAQSLKENQRERSREHFDIEQPGRLD